MMARVLGLALVLVACSPAATNAVIEVRPVTSDVAVLPPSANTSPDQTPIAQATLATPFMAGQEWIGRYVCPQGETWLMLHVARVEGRQVDAVFDFRHIQTAAVGKYKISGRWDPSTHQITFVPGDWLEQPSGYTSVGMTGVVSGATFEGKIDYPTCGGFELVLGNEDDTDWD